MFDGRVQIYRRENSRFWQCATRIEGRRFRDSTGEENLDQAKDVAEEWYLDLRGKLRRGEIIKNERKFKEAAEHYLREVRVLAASTRSPKYVEITELRLKAHILPFFGDTALSEIKRGLVQSYRVKRAENTIARTAKPAKNGEPARLGKPPARSTMTQEIVIIRQVLKCAEGMGWIPFVPNLSQSYMSQGKKGRRAWFSPEEYKQLYTATRKRITDCTRPGWKSHCEDLHDYVLFMANTGLRPDEAAKLEFRDITIEDDVSTKQTILVIDVRGKTGVGFCKSMPGAVEPFRRLKARREKEVNKGLPPDTPPQQLKPTDFVFRKFKRHMFNQILKEEGLKTDRDGRPRTAYSLRHTYISTRLMEGANIHQIANNCRTSVKMIEEFYAAHIKDRLDAGAINVQRPKIRRPLPRPRRTPTVNDSEKHLDS